MTTQPPAIRTHLRSNDAQAQFDARITRNSEDGDPDRQHRRARGGSPNIGVGCAFSSTQARIIRWGDGILLGDGCAGGDTRRPWSERRRRPSKRGPRSRQQASLASNPMRAILRPFERMVETAARGAFFALARARSTGASSQAESFHAKKMAPGCHPMPFKGTLPEGRVCLTGLTRPTRFPQAWFGSVLLWERTAVS
jgi:hypothetical protein